MSQPGPKQLCPAHPATAAAPGRRGNIARKVALAVAMVGILVSGLGFFVNLALEYDKATKEIFSHFREAEGSDLPLLTMSAWTANTAMAQAQLDAMVARVYVDYAELTLDTKTVLRSGRPVPESEGAVRRSYPLIHEFEGRQVQVGSLVLEAGYGEVRARVRKSAQLLFTSQGLSVAVSVGLILLFFHLYVYRRLRTISNYAQNLTPDNLDRPLVLEDKGGGRSGDELDMLGGAMNAMRENLRQSLTDLRQANERLTIEVAWRAHAQEELTHSIQMLDRTQGMAQLGSWELELATGRLTWSAEVFRIFGLDPQLVECSYNTFMAYVHPLDRAMVAEAFRVSLMPGQKDYEIEHRVLRPDGEVRVVLERSIHERDDSGCVTRSVGMVHDITERKRAESALASERQILTRIIEGTNDAVFVKDRQGCYMRVNSETSRVVGRPADEIVGRDDRALFPEEEALALMNLDHGIMHGGGVVTGEEHVTTMDGQRTYLATKGPLYDEAGEVIGLFGISRDITERKRIENELLVSKEAAEAANRAKSEFLANMSHEIRTPLNGVLGMLHLIRTSEVSGAVQSYAEMAIRAGQRLTSLLGDILDLSRIEAGLMPLASQPFALADIFAALAETFSTMHFSKSLSLVTNASSGVPTDVVGDEIRVRQVLFNLVGNAMKFSDEGEVRVDVSTLMPHPSGMLRLLFVVSDTGLGIPDEKVGQICAPFVQVSSDFTRSHQGAGLGLSIARRLIDAMGGTLTFESTEGQGTSVYLTLPFAIPAYSALAATPEPRHGAESAASLRLLLVEDEEISRLSARLTLEKMGHQVVTANNGEEALEALRGSTYDCVLMDVQMDVMDGVEATRSIRDGSSGALDAQIPIIAMTAYAMTGDREKFLEAGMNDYVAKPVQVEELKKALAQVAEKMGKRDKQ